MKTDCKETARTSKDDELQRKQQRGWNVKAGADMTACKGRRKYHKKVRGL